MKKRLFDMSELKKKEGGSGLKIKMRKTIEED